MLMPPSVTWLWAILALWLLLLAVLFVIEGADAVTEPVAVGDSKAQPAM